MDVNLLKKYEAYLNKSNYEYFFVDLKDTNYFLNYNLNLSNLMQVCYAKMLKNSISIYCM